MARPIGPAGLADIDRLLRVLADPTRIRILNALMAGDLRVRDLVNVLGLSQPIVSRHLAHLRRAGVVEPTRDFKLAPYRISQPASVMHQALMDCVRQCCDTVEVLQEERRRADVASHLR